MTSFHYTVIRCFDVCFQERLWKKNTNIYETSNSYNEQNVMIDFHIGVICLELYCRVLHNRAVCPEEGVVCKKAISQIYERLVKQMTTYLLREKEMSLLSSLRKWMATHYEVMCNKIVSSVAKICWKEEWLFSKQTFLGCINAWNNQMTN